MNPLLQVEHLQKYFKTSKGMLHAVDDVSFSVNEGETIGVVGESGCGKSTMGRTVLHLSEPTGGKIIFKGKDITSIDKAEFKRLRRDMQMIFQDPFSSLDPRKSIRETIEEPLIIYKQYRDRKEQDAYVDRLMETVGLTQRMGSCYPHELDGGRRQRAGIARALALDPSFIVCDEPVSALDVSIQAQILNLMQDLQEERHLTYMFITHDLSVVKHLATHIMVMYLGRMVEYAGADEIFDNPLHPYTQALLSAVPVIDLKRKRSRIVLKGEITSPIDPKPGCCFAPRCRCCGGQCQEVTPELKELRPGHFVSCFDCGR